MKAITHTTPATPKKARRFLLARHGETNFNKERRIQGTLDGPCVLTLDGISQAAALGMYVARRQAGEAMEGYGNVANEGDDATNDDGGGAVETSLSSAAPDAAAPPVTRTWCSPLTRCRQTYAAVSGCTSPSINSSYVGCICPLPEPTIHADLHEIDFREWQGVLRSEVIAKYGEQWEAFKKDPKSLRLNEGFAPVLDMWERGSNNWNVIRTDAAASATATRESNENNPEGEDDGDRVIFIMAHGAIGQCMLLLALGISIETYGKGKKYAFDNCDCVELEWFDGEECARQWRRVHPVATQWQSASASRGMASGVGLRCGRYDTPAP